MERDAVVIDVLAGFGVYELAQNLDARNLGHLTEATNFKASALVLSAIWIAITVILIRTPEIGVEVVPAVRTTPQCMGRPVVPGATSSAMAFWARLRQAGTPWPPEDGSSNPGRLDERNAGQNQRRQRQRVATAVVDRALCGIAVEGRRICIANLR